MPKASLSYRRLAAAGVTVAVLGAALLAFAYPQWREQTATQAAPPVMQLASASPRIGMGTPLTGAGATHGIQLKAGVEQAVDDINAAGGMLGHKITTTIGDDRSDPQEGVSVARRFAGDGVKFVVGHISTGVTIPASEVYLEHGILAITPAATNPRVTERNMWNIFRTCGRDDQQGLVAGEYILKNFKGQKIAIVHDKTTYGQGLADVTRATINKGGMKDVLYEGVNVGGRDYSAVVSRIKASGADLVYWGGLYDPGAMILRQMRDQGVKATLMGGDGITDHQLSAIAGAAAEGTLLTYGPDPRKRPQAKDVVAKFRAKNFDPLASTLYSYAAVEIIKQAAEAARSLDPKKVAEQMKSGMTFNTVLGDISYDKKGDVTRLDYVVYVWKKDAGGKITYAEIE
jgi:branched-chain amino acid transport system substrate-binding protein